MQQIEEEFDLTVEEVIDLIHQCEIEGKTVSALCRMINQVFSRGYDQGRLSALNQILLYHGQEYAE